MTWYAEKSVSDGRWRVKSDDDLIATVHGDNAEKDANLIAASSELLEAAHAAVTLFEAWRDGFFARAGFVWEKEPPGIVACRNAISSAEGRKP
jgi:hypothetical protein